MEACITIEVVLAPLTFVLADSRAIRSETLLAGLRSSCCFGSVGLSLDDTFIFFASAAG